LNWKQKINPIGSLSFNKTKFQVITWKKENYAQETDEMFKFDHLFFKKENEKNILIYDALFGNWNMINYCNEIRKRINRELTDYYMPLIFVWI
jgi:hypothetical protein